jgi:ATP-dependent RNA helicase DeaD
MSTEPTFEQPENPLPRISVADLPPSWLEALSRMGWNALMPVQSLSIPYVMASRDIAVQSRTGSGKTGAFLLPLLEKVNQLQADTQALILVPTRELANQVHQEAHTLFAGTGIRSVAVYGGVKYGPQLAAFREGAHVVIGTPGRILDHLIRGSLKLKALQLLIFDEADRMLSMGFYPDMRAIQAHLPKHRVETYMFSATFPRHVLRLAEEFQQEPSILSLSTDHVHVTDTEHVYYAVTGIDKDRSLVRIIEAINPDRAIIFCNTRARVHYVKVVLQRFGYNADEITSDLSQNQRERVMGRLRDGKLRFLVATDVAARGIDIPELSHVIQFEPPENPEDYIHRAGRTGRAGGATGEAITLIDIVEKLRLLNIGKAYEIEFQERAVPTDDEVASLVRQRAIALLEAKARDRDKLKTERMERFLPLVQELADEEELQLLVAMVLDDYYHQAFHDPPPLPADAPRRERPGRSDRRRRRQRK